MRLLQNIASGLLGRVAFTQGWLSAILGLLLHYFIATTAATIYILASRASRSPAIHSSSAHSMASLSTSS